MQTAVPLACFLSLIRPPGIQYENSLLQIVPVNKFKCPYIKNTNDVGFQLFTRHNPTVYQELVVDDDEKLFASNIDFHDKTVLYFHGWMEQPEDGSAIMVREAYMQRGDTNVIMVDAHHLEAGPWYFTAAQNTWYIGKFAAKFIDYLASRGLNLNNTHLIGHSLGAHIAGVASSSLKYGRVARLTALDPALPLFEHLPLEQRLDPSDAHFIDVIHSDAGIFGYKFPTGHVDFYPNGGTSPQPGCELEVVIPQQQLLNKCEGRTQTNGFYGYFLTANQKPDLQRKTFESKLHNLFSYIHSVKNKNGTHENGVKVEKNAKESGDKKPEENYANLEAIINADHNAKFNNTTKDIDKDNEDYGKKTDEYEDQIADASEYVETRVEYHEALKEKETTSLFKESSQLVLEKSKTKVSEHSKTKQQTQNGDKDLETHNDKLNTKDKDSNITIFNPESTVKSETTTNASNKKTRDIIVQELNYKDPCNPKTTEDYNNNESTTEDNVVIESPVKEVNGVKPIDRPKPKVNVLNLLGTTYRIGRIISAFHQNKEKSIFKKLKHGFFKTTTTTPKSIFNQIKFKLMPKNRLLKRQKRFLPFLKRSEDTNSNMLTKVLEFLVKNRKNVLPVFMVMREINTLVKSSNGELNHSSKEQNSYIGGSTPPVFEPVTYTLELGGENKVTAFIKRLVGIAPKGDRLTIGSGK